MRALIVLTTITILSSLAPHSALALYTKVTGIDGTQIRRVLYLPQQQKLAIASKSSLYTGKPEGPFRKIVTLKGESANHLYAEDNTLYLAGSRNAYQIDETTPKRIFTADEAETLYTIISHNNHLYIGTSRRLVYADQSLLNWKTLPALSDTAVFSMHSNGKNLYIAAEDGAYCMNADLTLNKLFTTRKSGDETSLRVRWIKTDTCVEGRLWLCTNKGLYISTDNGNAWQKLFITGLGNTSVNYLAQNPENLDSIYICSDAGLYAVNAENGQAEPLYQGIPTSKTQWIDFTPDGTVYLATDQGLFNSRTTPAFSPMIALNDLEQLMIGEPTIREVQDAALNYNSVHPTKTGKWRKKLKYRALLPRFNVDYDKTIGSSFTQSGHYYATGPYDWGVSLTWDMGNLIWNSYEDDIDNRTKLTTQLRMDILDEVNRLYFERLRLKHEIMQSDPSTLDTFEKALRLAELTATLDGYTGGLYSAELDAVTDEK